MKHKIDREIDDPANYKFSIFYCNKRDKRVIVPKLDSYRGWTLNFGNFRTYLAILLIGIVMLVASLVL